MSKTRYTSLASGNTWKTVSCESCPVDFAYEVTREGMGMATGASSHDEARPQERARQAADASLERALRRAVDPVPCPGCGRYQRVMVEQLRDKKVRWLSLLLFSLLLFALPFFAVNCASGESLPRAAVSGPAGFALPAAAVLFVLRYLLRRLHDPNMGAEQRVGQGPQDGRDWMFRHEYEQRRKEALAEGVSPEQLPVLTWPRPPSDAPPPVRRPLQKAAGVPRAAGFENDPSPLRRKAALFWGALFLVCGGTNFTTNYVLEDGELVVVTLGRPFAITLDGQPFPPSLDQGSHLRLFVPYGCHQVTLKNLDSGQERRFEVLVTGFTRSVLPTDEGQCFARFDVSDSLERGRIQARKPPPSLESRHEADAPFRIPENTFFSPGSLGRARREFGSVYLLASVPCETLRQPEAELRRLAGVTP
jgi:hypothetical protein